MTSPVIHTVDYPSERGGQRKKQTSDQHKKKGYKKRHSERVAKNIRCSFFISIAKNYGFKTSMFTNEQKVSKPEEKKAWLSIDKTTSLFDKLLCDIPAQYANDAVTPTYRWADCKTKLRNIDTSKLHYISGMKENHIVIDFDIRGEDGNKSMEKNLEAAEKWPKTYAEFSKSGAGIHLHYLWVSQHPLFPSYILQFCICQ